MENHYIDETIFNLPAVGLNDEDRLSALDVFRKYIGIKKNHFLGYQSCNKLDYVEDLKDFLEYHINNIGDPFSPGYFAMNSKVLEKAVLDYYATLWNAKTPHKPKDKDSYWGYVLTMGSTEGNLYGLWNARDYLSGRKLVLDKAKECNNKCRQKIFKTKYLEADHKKHHPNAFNPVAFFSQDTHYSIIKATRVLKILTPYEAGVKKYPGENPLSKTGEWSRDLTEVPSVEGKEGTGSIDIEKLKILVKFFASKNHPIIINCNLGTTFKGAYDDVEKIGRALMPVFEKYGLVNRKVVYDEKGDEDIRNGYWIHVDGALGAAYLPYLEMAYKREKLDAHGPVFDFRLPFVNSIVMSGHKWIGSPWPCGVFMTKVGYQLYPPDEPGYIGSMDTTFAGSRNGMSAIILWNYLAKTSYEKQIEKALNCETLALYAEEKLRKVQESYPDLDLWIERTPLSLTVRFRKPNDRIVAKHTLSCETLIADGEERAHAHIFIMDSVSRENIDEFAKDLLAPDAYTKEDIENSLKKINVRGYGFKSELGRGWR